MPCRTRRPRTGSQALAVANAKPGQDATVDNNLTLNPAVPRNVGVRVVELTSTRFPEGSAEVLPAHAAELDRIVNVMNALPQHHGARSSATPISVASELANYVISEQRALRRRRTTSPRGASRRIVCRPGPSARPTC